MTGIVADLIAAGVPVSVDDEDRAAASTDRSGAVADGLPAAVVRAASAGQVSAALRAAHRRGVPVVPRGAGTGLAGGAVAGTGSIVLDLSGLNRIVDIDAGNELAVVEAGVLTADLDAAAARHGLRYAPDPASVAISTIGGNIATNAGGMRCVKYGVTRQAVLGLDVVLADGTPITTGRRTVKGVSGLDLTSLFVGSEGTLGVVVGATLALRPIPERTVTIAAGFADVGAAAAACADVALRRGDPAVLELLDGATLAVVDKAQGTGFSSRAHALVVAMADGRAAEADAAVIAEALGTRALWCEAGTDPETADALIAARRLALPSIETFGKALIEDICVPRTRLADAFGRVGDIASRHGVDVFTFAHAGDGNIHPILSYDPALAAPPPAIHAAADDIFGLALDLGGTITGEHGVGLLKRDWLARESGPEVIAAQHAIKAALDPTGILNPGKGF